MAEKRDDVVSAFPNNCDGPKYDGMSLRDWFAGQALAGLCSNPGGPIQANGMSGWGLVNCTMGDVAREAYAIADAMLEARKQ